MEKKREREREREKEREREREREKGGEGGQVSFPQKRNPEHWQPVRWSQTDWRY